MSSPVFGTDSDYVDQNFPFYYSDNLWSLLDDHSSTILANDNGNDRVQVHSSLVPPCPLLDENCILLPVEEELDDDKTNCELNSSCIFLDQQENSALAGPIMTDKGLLENGINEQDATLKAVENLCRIMEENQDAGVNHHNHGNSFSNCTVEGTSNESWPLILEEGSHENSGGFYSSIFTEQAEASPAQAMPKLTAKTKERNHNLKRLQSAENAVQPINGDEGQVSKKQEHNAKEKIRRMKLSATYIALGALLPDHRRTKKRTRTAPGMIDRALEYIPEIEKEIEDLTLRKNTLLSRIEKQNLRETPPAELSDELRALSSTVSLNEVAKGEVIVQITCMTKKDKETSVFSNLLQNVEAQGISILSASTLQVCMDRVCYHLHLKMKWSSLAADYIAILREKVISWLA